MSDDLSAVDVAATVVTVRVDTEEGMLVRAKRVVLPASLLLNCKHSLSLAFRRWISYGPDFGVDFGTSANFFLLYSRGGFGRGRGAAPPS